MSISSTYELTAIPLFLTFDLMSLTVECNLYLLLHLVNIATPTMSVDMAGTWSYVWLRLSSSGLEQ